MNRLLDEVAFVQIGEGKAYNFLISISISRRSKKDLH